MLFIALLKKEFHWTWKQEGFGDSDKSSFSDQKQDYDGRVESKMWRLKMVVWGIHKALLQYFFPIRLLFMMPLILVLINNTVDLLKMQNNTEEFSLSQIM